MTERKPSFIIRLFLAFAVYFRFLISREFAAQVLRFKRGEAPAPAPVPELPRPAVLKDTAPESALQVLGLLQQEGRFIDFLEEDVAAYSDAEIGAAARLIHEGCRKVLREHLNLEPIRQEAEGSRLTLEQGFDAAAVRLAGNVVGKPPFKGTLVHRGWRAAQVRLPKLAEGHDVTVLAPAEVEL